MGLGMVNKFFVMVEINSKEGFMLKDNAVIDIYNNGLCARITVSKEFFERETLFLTASSCSSEFFVNIMPKGEFLVEMNFEYKNKIQFSENILKEILNMLIDNQMRIDLQREFGSLRDKIVKHAFSPLGE